MHIKLVYFIQLVISNYHILVALLILPPSLKVFQYDMSEQFDNIEDARVQH